MPPCWQACPRRARPRPVASARAPPCRVRASAPPRSTTRPPRTIHTRPGPRARARSVPPSPDGDGGERAAAAHPAADACRRRIPTCRCTGPAQCARTISLSISRPGKRYLSMHTARAGAVYFGGVLIHIHAYIHTYITDSTEPERARTHTRGRRKEGPTARIFCLLVHVVWIGRA